MPSVHDNEQPKNAPDATSNPSEFSIEVISSTTATREALLQVIAGLAPIGLDPEDSETVELILAEVLNNIVEHAYPEVGTVGAIYIRCRHLADGLHFRIRDFGNRMPDDKAPLGEMRSYDVDVEDLPEGGFGWFLIRDLAKDVHYSRIAGGNQLDLRIAVDYG